MAYYQTNVGDQMSKGIYGVCHKINESPTAWRRIDDCVSMFASASVRNTAGSSDFDNVYPWSDMQREVLSTGDVMVKIPEFYFQRYVEENTEYIRIAGKKRKGFVLHPGSGRYVGAYKTSSNNKSVTGASPQVNQIRATMRTNARAKGDGWGIIDLATASAICMLYLVEFANTDSQSMIGAGHTSGSAAIATGSCNTVPNLTGKSPSTADIVYRGIEGFWGNVWEWMDGLNVNNGVYYVCTDPTKYADDTDTDYTVVGGFHGETNWLNTFIKTMGMDDELPWVLLPQVASGASSSTYWADAVWSSTGWRVAQRGGRWSDGASCGAFTLRVEVASSYTGSHIGSRLLYVPS